MYSYFLERFITVALHKLTSSTDKEIMIESNITSFTDTLTFYLILQLQDEFQSVMTSFILGRNKRKFEGMNDS